MKSTLVKSLLALVVGSLALVGNAMATPVLTLSDGTTTETIYDNGAGDTNLMMGVTTFNAILGTNPNINWIVNVTTGLTKPIIGSTTSPKLDLNSINVTSSGASTLEVVWLADGFDASNVTGFFTGIGGTTAGTVNFQSWYSSTNSSLFDSTDTTNWTLLSNLGTFNPTSFEGNALSSGSFSNSASFALVATITHTAAGQSTSFNGLMQPVPEPATMFLFGTGLIGLAAAGRKKRAKK